MPGPRLSHPWESRSGEGRVWPRGIPTVTIHIRLLGGFDVDIDGATVPPVSWARRHAAALVKLLALADGHRLHRERVITALWPALAVEVAAPRLHKAAHFARKALERGGGTVSLRDDVVALLADSAIEVDVDRFRTLAARASAGRDAALAAVALELYRGDLLPDDVYDEWATEARDELAATHLELLRLTHRWEDLVARSPTDEESHLALARRYVDGGDARAALRQLERLERALHHELGAGLGPDARALKAQLESRSHSAPQATAPRLRLVARRSIGDRIRDRLRRAADGRGGAIVLRGPAGVGKTALLELTAGIASREGFRVARWAASSVEGQWPYGPVMGALAGLCRAHPALLDGLGDTQRAEIERALVAGDLPWTGEAAHPRLFVATSELVRIGAEGTGLILMVDDIHEADDASLRLLHYLGRCARECAALVVLAGRPLRGRAAEIVESMVGSDEGALIDVPPLPAGAVEHLLAELFPALGETSVRSIAAASGGIPFTALELARRESSGGSGGLIPSLPAGVLRTVRRVAMLANAFSTDEFLAMSDADPDVAHTQLGQAVAAMIVEPAEVGYRFRHPMIRDAIVEGIPPHEQAAERHEVATRLGRSGAAPARVAQLFIEASQPSHAVPFVLRAVETAGALGAYQDALNLVDHVVAYAGPADQARLLARRADLLMAMGSPDAVDAYRDAAAVATGTDRRLLRARLSRVLAYSGELDTARAALAGLEPEGDAADAAILLAQAVVAYFAGDLDGAWEVTVLARERVDLGDAGWQVLDLVSLQGLIAHHRGEWFDRFQLELRRTAGRQSLATSVFDAHLCVAEFVLYGQVPYDELIADVERLRDIAQRTGALRGVAFATALIGEAALLKGDLDRAEHDLNSAVQLHREIGATAGEASCMQRLAEVHLARGDRDAAHRLLHAALPLARWSVLSLHLVQRVYGTMVTAAPTPADARAVVDRAMATIAETDRCMVCDVMLAVPAAIACADAGDPDEARRHLAVAEQSAARFDRVAWHGALAEARAHIALAEGARATAEREFAAAADLFALAGHERDAARCRGGIAVAS
ncbi:ATP-binding protein [Microbacterium cremeum]|uniref:ATP-binding protein n=1 Tax=Microbacterium cremeum TaxID=2782169 RepID=UPI00188783CA|nr:AAA family ATPase [Microbacterium cremeum]